MHTEPQHALIFGATDLAQVLYANLRASQERPVAAFVVDAAWRRTDRLLGLPVVDAEDMALRFPPENFGCYVALGYSAMNEHRRRTFARLRHMGYALLEYRHPSAIVETRDLGQGNLFFQRVFVDHFTALGSGNIFYPGASLAHHSRAGDFNFFAVSACVAGHVRMGDNNFVGANATLRDHISLDHHCLVGAGACLTRDLAAWQTFAPARGCLLRDRKSTDFL